MRIILLALLLWFSGCSTALAPGLQDIKLEVSNQWMRDCQNYFWWRTPRITAYRGGSSAELLHPDEWCRVEAKTILRDRVPFDYITNINDNR